MTSTARSLAGVITALFAPDARLYEMNAALGVVIVCVAFATTIEVMMATTVAMRMTPGRENFWIRILIAFILCWFLCVGFFLLVFLCVGRKDCSCIVFNCRDVLASVLQVQVFLFFSRGWEGRSERVPRFNQYPPH